MATDQTPPTSRTHTASANLSAMARLFGDDLLESGPPPITVDAGTATLTVEHAAVNYEHNVWEFTVRVRHGEKSARGRAHVDDGVLRDYRHVAGPQLDSGTVDTVTDLLCAATMDEGSAALADWCAAVRHLTELRGIVGGLCDDQALRNIVASLAGGTAATLAADWAGDLAELAATVARLDRTTP